MTAATKFQPYIEYVFEKKIDHQADTFKVALCNTAPVSTNGLFGDLTEISAGNGYTAGGNTATVSTSAQTTGTYKLVLASPTTWTASGGSIGPFRYAVLYDSTPSSPLKPLVLFWDYGSSITLASGETFSVTFDGTTGVLTCV